MSDIDETAQEQEQYGAYFADEVKNVIRLTLAFAKAVGDAQTDKKENLVVSPYNYMRFLSMVAKGAGGQTKEELAQVLFQVSAGQLDAEIEKILTLNHDILETNKGQVELKTAAGLWANSDRTALNAGFARSLEKLFEARVSSESFSANPDAVVTGINGWAKESTSGLISKIIDKITPDMVAVMASALYFEGNWTKRFDETLTKDKAFTADGGKKALTPMMKQKYEEGDVTYLKGADYQAVALTYGEDDYRQGRYPSMRIVLVRPGDKNQSARDWLAGQADGTVPAWLDPSAYTDAVGTVMLPRIDIEQEHDLKTPLREAGLENTMSTQADFSGMTKNGARNIVLSKVKENIVFQTDEKGTKAASIVSGTFMATSVRMPPPRINIEFNRSFALAVQDIKTGAVLFIGAVNKPNKETKAAPAP